MNVFDHKNLTPIERLAIVGFATVVVLRLSFVIVVGYLLWRTCRIVFNF